MALIPAGPAGVAVAGTGVAGLGVAVAGIGVGVGSPGAVVAVGTAGLGVAVGTVGLGVAVACGLGVAVAGIGVGVSSSPPQAAATSAMAIRRLNAPSTAMRRRDSPFPRIPCNLLICLLSKLGSPRGVSITYLLPCFGVSIH